MLRSGRPCSGGGEEIQCTTCHLDVAPDHDLVHPLLGALLPAHRVLQVLALLAVRGRAHGARGVVNLRNARQLRIELIALTVWLPNFCLKGKLQRLLVLGPPTVLHLHPPLLSTIYTCTIYCQVTHHLLSIIFSRIIIYLLTQTLCM